MTSMVHYPADEDMASTTYTYPMQIRRGRPIYIGEYTAIEFRVMVAIGDTCHANICRWCGAPIPLTESACQKCEPF